MTTRLPLVNGQKGGTSSDIRSGLLIISPLADI